MYLKLHILDNCTYPGTVDHLNTVNLSLNLRIAQAPPALSPPLSPLHGEHWEKIMQITSKKQRTAGAEMCSRSDGKVEKKNAAPPSCHFCQESASNRCSCLIGASTLLLTRAAPCRSHQQHGRRWRQRHRQSLSAVIGCRATWLASSFLLPAALHCAAPSFNIICGRQSCFYDTHCKWQALCCIVHCDFRNESERANGQHSLFCLYPSSASIPLL